MMVFVDTSALYNLLDRSAIEHIQAGGQWRALIGQKGSLYTTNYIVTETVALVQNRLGMAAVKDLYDRIIPILEVEWIDESLHKAGVAALLTANRRQLSLVDCTSFIVCRQLGVNAVFAYDEHFEEQGFLCLR